MLVAMFIHMMFYLMEVKTKWTSHVTIMCFALTPGWVFRNEGEREIERGREKGERGRETVEEKKQKENIYFHNVKSQEKKVYIQEKKKLINKKDGLDNLSID